MKISKLLNIKRDTFSMDKSKYLRLDSNERVIPFSKKEINEFTGVVKDFVLQSYPMNRKKILSKLATIEKVNLNEISITPGADTSLKYLFEIFNSRKGKIATIYPTYGMIDVYAKIYGKKVLKIFEDQVEFLNNLNNYKNIAFIYLANPNSPSGQIIKKKNLLKIISNSNKMNIPLLIDETYIEFSKIDSVKTRIKKFKNLIIIRTFSKFPGIAGLRIGCLISNPQNIKIFNTIRPPHDISHLSIKILEILIKNKKSYLGEINKSKKYIKKICKKNNLKYIMTETNFFHIIFNSKLIKSITEQLYKRKILINSGYAQYSKVMYTGAKNSLRVSMGSVKQMNFFFKNLFEILKK
jgi:histidinol-phosphate aminotransferase